MMTISNYMYTADYSIRREISKVKPGPLHSMQVLNVYVLIYLNETMRNLYRYIWSENVQSSWKRVRILKFCFP